jgi:GT2 family glycosyltransferase
MPHLEGPKVAMTVEPIEPVEEPTQPGGYVKGVRRSYVKEQYPALVRNNRLGATGLAHLRDEASNFGFRPLVSIILPVSGPERRWLERTLDSLMGQVYPSWELRVCGDGSTPERARDVLSRYERMDGRIKVTYLEQNASISRSLNMSLSLAEGEFAASLGHGDELPPDALFEMVKLLQEHPGADLVYSDADEIDEEGNRVDPRFKPGWSPDLLLSTNYISHLSVYRKSLLQEVGGFREEFDGCQGYDLVLRATERTDEIRHVPKVLYHRRAATDSSASPGGRESHIRDGARRALSEALERRGIEGSVEDGLLPDSLRVRRRIEGEPKISIIIPTRDNVSLLKNCIESIERLTTYRNYEILIVDNDSADPATVEYLGSTPHQVIPFGEEFNYSRINNFGVSQAEGEYVLLLNDDTEVISGEWLHAMLEHAQRPEVGAVGARLLYPDGRVQHAGVLIGVGDTWGPGVATHSHQFYSSYGYLGAVATTTNYSAVTAACMLLRKSVFEEVEGFDEENLRVAYNDVDLCLRIRERGYLVVYTPYAELYHHESATRGYTRRPAETSYMRERWGEVLDNDPYYNANFSRGSGDFNLRADLLRPKSLRPEEDPGSSFKNPLTTSPEELKRNMEAQQRAIRDSPRTGLVPGSEKETARTALLESLEHHEDGPPRDDLQEPTDHAAEETGPRRPASTEQLIWMFGSPRTGSTWLSKMMAELDNQKRWHEPYVGLLFGSFLYERLEGNDKLLNSATFIMGAPYRKVWIESVKNFIIEGATARYPGLTEGSYLVVKEPNGSLGAPLLLEATPDSRLIFLIRDSRDVIASLLDATRKGSWTEQGRDVDTSEKLNALTKHLAEEHLKMVSQVQKAYEAHPGKKALVRYEDLRHDTLGTLKAMYGALEMEFDEAQLEAAVAKHSWEQVPDSDKGEGKFHRKAQPGGWREDLSPEQIEIIEDITEPILSRYYQPRA